MTTSVTTTVISHTSDADFRTWVAEVIAQITAVGIVQTADTGQINTGTATRPGTNTNGGYAIFRFDDSMQGTAPIFFRIDFGTSFSATAVRMQLTVGTATNGSGTISGLGIVATNFANGAPTSAVTNYTTRVCAVDGFLGFMWKLGGAGVGAVGFFAIARSVDSSESPTGDAAVIYTSNSNPGVVMARYAAGGNYAMEVGSYCLIHGGLTSSLVGGAAQVFRHYMVLPEVVPNMFLLTVLSGELGNNTTFTAAPINATSHTFISSGVQGIGQVGLPALSTRVMAMFWE
jgi:hypothetical protein